MSPTYHFDYTTGNPDNLVGGHPAQMIDLQGSFYDLRAFLNSGVFDALAALTPPVSIATAAPVLDVGLTGQLRAGRQLALADFNTLCALPTVPVGLWNLSDLTNLGTGSALVNKGAVPFGVGINGGAATAAVFAGSTGQALYIADTGAADPFRLRTGSAGCWFRTAKRATEQALVSKYRSGLINFMLYISGGSNVVGWVIGTDGTASVTTPGISDVCDDRWHFVVGTIDGTTARLYIDGALESVGSVGPAYPTSTAPLNVGGYGADGATAATSPCYGRVDEAFVTPDVLTDDQVRLLYCAKLAHTLAVVPTRANLLVRRRRKGGPLAVTDFPATPVRLHNFTAGSLNDEGSGGIALTNATPTLIVSVAGADGSLGSAYSFSGAHTGLSSTDAGLPAGTAARSYGCWFKTTTASSMIAMAWGQTVGTTDIRIGVDSAGAILALNGADSISGPFARDGQWHQLIAVEDNAAGDGVRRKIYLDGRLVGVSTVLNALTFGGANSFRIGADRGGGSPWTGQVDRAFVYAGALTMEQVAALYAKGTQALGGSIKEPGAHVEAMDSASAYITFDTLDSQHTIDLAVAS